MKTEQPTPSLNKRLHKAQQQHVRRLERVEKTLTKLEKGRTKLYALEHKIASLASTIHEQTITLPPAAVQPAAYRQARLIFNPRSKMASDGTYRLEDIVSHLRLHGIQAEVGFKTSGKVARALAREAVDQGVDMVIVAGGDGTIEDVAGELVGTPTSLGILPLGTMNNLARALGIPLLLDDACALLGGGITRHIDIGRLKDAVGTTKTYFLETASVGLTALAAPIGQDEEKGRWGALPEALRKFFGSHAVHVTVVCDEGVVQQALTHVVTVSNAPLYGKHTLMAPNAYMDDGLLDLALFHDMGKLDVERYFIAATDAHHPNHPQVTFHQVRRVQITAEEPIEASADLHVFDPEHIWIMEVVPHALAVIAGKGVALRLPVDAVPSVPPLSGPQEPNTPHQSVAPDQPVAAPTVMLTDH